tara:strand:+ start:851 stop:1612 length:762 start_codon:yes stop_codon:yes gene_type:complete
VLKKRIIPCLDVNEGRTVKGINFKNLVDAGDPAEQARIYSEEGADEITFLDITATSDEREAMINVISKTSNECFVPLTVGGGVRSVKDIKKFLLAGADKVSINSAAITNPNLIAEGANKFGNQCIVVAIDAKKSSNKWEVYSHGGRTNSLIDAIEWASFVESKGAGEILLTSMDRDGTKSGFDLELLKQITQKVKIPVIASGGVGKLEHLSEGILFGGASAVLAASVFHFKNFSITEAKKHLQSKKIAVRMDY